MNEVLFDAIPEPLCRLPHWVVWKLETRDEKQTKVPYNAKTGGKAQSNNPSTWTTLEIARKTYSKGGYSGIGFMLSRESRVVGVDLDHCFDAATGEIQAAALAIVDALATYTEITPSGAGLRLFCFGELPEGGRKRGGVEFYDAGRFLTVTGNVLRGGDIRECNGDLQRLHGEIFPPKSESVHSDSEPLDMDDQELFKKMFAAKNGSKIRDLYEGSWEAHYKSRSEADSGFCCHLAFWTGRDPARIDSIFRSSGLMRSKWDEKHGEKTYGHTTIDRACGITKTTYQPPVQIRLRGRAARRFAQGHSASQAAEWNEEQDGADEDEKALNNGLYAAENGRTVLRIVKTIGKGEEKKEVEEYSPVVDLVATISKEYRYEDGRAVFGVEGRTLNNRHFEVEIEGDKITDSKTVSALLANVADAGCVFYARKECHLGPAIKSFSVSEEIEVARRFRRVGWTRDMKEFIIPGMESKDVEITLDKELAYRVVPPEGNSQRLPEGVANTLTNLLNAHRTQLTTVALSHVLLAPLAALCGWRDDKFALFIAGQTGSFKTSWAQMAMCIYGDFSNEDTLLKFGMGGTANAMMSFIADACDMPLLIDNFKPGTGQGQRDATSLIHGVLEGTEKKRLNRDGTRRFAKEIHCWPILTGEDIVDDAASVARTLILPASWDKGLDNPALTAVQSHSHLLQQVGGAWITWLLTDEAKVVGDYAKSQFIPLRAEWATFLRKHRPDMVNVNRVASSLALCRCGWEVALGCPYLEPVLAPYTARLKKGLEECALAMGTYSAQTFEANRYLAAIRSMILSNRGYVVPRYQKPDKEDRRVFLGWEGTEKPKNATDIDCLYADPGTLFTEVLKFLRDAGGLNGVGANTIHKQLDQLGCLAATEGGHFAVKRMVDGSNEKPRVLCIKWQSIFEPEEAPVPES